MSKPESATACLVGEGYTLTPFDREMLAAHLRISPVPDFEADDTACVEALNARCAQVMVRPSTHGKHVCLFDDGQLHVTVGCETEGMAAALALLFLIRRDKSQVT